MRLKMGPWILLSDIGPIPGVDNPDARFSAANGNLSQNAASTAEPLPTPAEAAQIPSKRKEPSDRLSYLNYIRFLQKNQPKRSDVERYGSGYQDYLQTPLQPLTDNLESMTYEVFETDPVKYDLYEKAIRLALRDWVNQKMPKSSPEGRVVVAVAGAGRGPLVTRALNASKAEKVPIELWAVEKNPNAYVLLTHHNKAEWQGQVMVVKSDMRSWKGPWRENASSTTSAKHAPSAMDQAPDQSPPVSAPSSGYTPIDILISELLGSFADNELSPECLDGILHLLAPHGISIPQSYTSFLTPIAAPKLHADISGRASWDANGAETPSVAWLHAFDYLSLLPNNPSPAAGATTSAAQSEPTTTSSTPNVLPVWSFHHKPLSEAQPLPVHNAHNARHSRLNFRTRYRGVCHGLAGYFESVLYPGIELSTNPNTMPEKSPSMISWFPIFFPLKVGDYFRSFCCFACRCLMDPETD